MYRNVPARRMHGRCKLFRGGLRRARDSPGSNTAGPRCTTSVKEAHGTIFRELLYPWHPWCALHVSIHEAIGKSNDLVFRCTLSGSDASRSVEIPAWMFDRAACGEARLTTAPYVSAAALSALRDLLRRALKDTSASSSAPLSGVSRTSRDQ